IKYSASYHGDRFDSWIFRIARNVFADHYQSNKMLRSFVTDDRIVDQPDDHGEEQHERERLLYQSLNRLAPDQRELLILTRFERMKYEDVASMMETTVSNIKIKVRRVIRRL